MSTNKIIITGFCWFLSAICFYMAYKTGYSWDNVVHDALLVLRLFGG